MYNSPNIVLVGTTKTAPLIGFRVLVMLRGLGDVRIALPLPFLLFILLVLIAGRSGVRSWPLPMPQVRVGRSVCGHQK